MLATSPRITPTVLPRCSCHSQLIRLSIIGYAFGPLPSRSEKIIHQQANLRDLQSSNILQILLDSRLYLLAEVRYTEFGLMAICSLITRPSTLWDTCGLISRTPSIDFMARIISTLIAGMVIAISPAGFLITTCCKPGFLGNMLANTARVRPSNTSYDAKDQPVFGVAKAACKKPSGSGRFIAAARYIPASAVEQQVVEE